MFPVTVRVTDSGEPPLTTERTFTVTVNEVNSAPVLAHIGNQSVNEGSVLNFVVTASDPNDIPANRLALSATGLPPGASFDLATGAFAWTPDEIQGPDTYPVTFTVTDDGTPPLSASETITITVNEANRPPSLDPISDSVIDEGTQLKFTASATDSDIPANKLTFSLGPSAPDGASGTFVCTPSEAQGPGVFPVTIRATDNGSPPLTAEQTFTVTVSEVSSAPVLEPIGNKTVNEGSALNFVVAASDPNDIPPNRLVLSATGLPPGAAFDTATGAFAWTPDEVQGPGTYQVTFTVTDDGQPPLSASETITITVDEVNSPPVLDPMSDSVIDEGTQLKFTASATDPDLPANQLTFSLGPGAPDGASIDSASGSFVWTPSEAQGPGVFPITVVMTDDGTPAETDSKMFTVTVNEANSSPQLSVVSDQSVDELSELTFAATATDADVPANKVTLSVAGLPEGASFDPATGEFRWTPTEEQGPGSYKVTFTATDDGVPSRSVSEVVTITVREVNRAPELSVVRDQVSEELRELTFAATATDGDLPLNKLTFGLAAGAPSGAAIDPATGAFTWTPSEGQGPGGYPVTITATDDGTPALSDSKTISVTVSEVNSAPKLAAIGEKSVDEVSELTFAATASDSDDALANKVTLSVAGLPEGATFDPAAGEFRWTPTEAQGPGSYAVTFTATDDGVPPLSASETVTITVNEVNAPPVLAAIGNKSVHEHQALAFTVAASDTNDRPPNGITLSAAGLPAGASFDPATGAFSWTPGEAQQGAQQVAFTATDDGTPPLSASETITITVNEVNDPPTVAITVPAPGAQFIAPAAIQIEATASDPEGALAKGEFFDGGTRLGEATDRPYAMRWENVLAGQHALTAKATDEHGDSAISLPVDFTVLASLRSAEVLADGSFRVTLLGEPDRPYAIEFSDDLKAWTPLRTETVKPDGTLTFTDSATAGLGQRFYRARKE